MNVIKRSLATKIGRYLRQPNLIPQRLLNQFIVALDWQAERTLKRKLPVKHRGEIIFYIRNFGLGTRFRALTFSDKEPETLTWIDGFVDGETLLDIGANIGIYTLYAAKKGITVRAIVNGGVIMCHRGGRAAAVAAV